MTVRRLEARPSARPNGGTAREIREPGSGRLVAKSDGSAINGSLVVSLDHQTVLVDTVC